MEHSTQVSILKQLMALVDNDVNVDAGVQLKIPMNSYTCPDLAAREWQTFFRDHPQLIGLSNDLPEPNTFMTADEFGVPVLATRDADGQFRAFVNACRHRGVRLVEAPCGHEERFRCPFHHWTYGTDGALRGLPRARDFGEVDRATHGLVPLPCEERHGMLWVHPQPDAELDVGALLAGLDQELEEWRPGELSFMGESVLDMALNWKLANDTFGETYHFARLHQATLNNLFYGDALVYDTFGRNHRFIFPSRSIDMIRQQPEEDWRLRAGALLVYFLFPNIQMIVGPNGINLVKIYPDGTNPGRSLTRSRHYYTPRTLELAAQDDRAQIDASNVYDPTLRDVPSKISIEATMEVFDSTIEKEDYRMGELTQRTAQAGTLEYLVFGRNEPALHHYHNTYRAALGMPALERYGE